MWKTLHILFVIILAVNGQATKKRVCIVGAGLSGLVATKYLDAYPDEFEPVVFEKNSDVGGQWIYTDSTTVDKHGLPVHSSVYKSLRTNGVKQVMTFQDYPHFGGNTTDSFVKHQIILEYLRNYTNHFGLHQYIQFNTNVENVSPLSNQRWLIVTQNLNTKKRNKTTCDAVFLCNGHEVKGNIPKIPGIKSFTGRVLHSHVYRKPDEFANQIVVVLGAKSSGTDISVDISLAAKKVYLSHRYDKLPDVFPSNIEQVAGVVAAENDYLILSDGTRLRADTLLLCTGYDYDFPFLSENSGIVIENGKYIRSLYKHLVNIEYPSMVIINVPQPGPYFIEPHAQMTYLIALLRGKLSLPSREQMLIEAQLPANVPKNKAHYLYGDAFLSYIDELSLAGGGELAPWWLRPVLEKMTELRNNDPVHYRSKRLVIHEDGRIEII